jgi:hypothetical protein
MSTVNLEDQEWNYVLGVLGDRPWRESNTILMKIGSQLRMQQDARLKTYQESEHSEKIPPVGTHKGERGAKGVLDGPRNSNG